jgi:hypothetical protein
MKSSKTVKQLDYSQENTRVGYKEPKEQINVQLYGPGNIIGEDDGIKERPHKTTARCKTSHGEVLQMKISEFFPKIKTVPESIRDIELSSNLKDLNLEKKIAVRTLIKNHKKNEKSTRD